MPQRGRPDGRGAPLSPRIVAALGAALALGVIAAALWRGGSQAPTGAQASTASVSDGAYTYSCVGASVQGTFSFSPSPSDAAFSVFLTYHVPGSAEFVPVPGASQSYPPPADSPVSFNLSIANVPADANTMRIENSMTTEKSNSFLCPAAPTQTPVPPATATSTPGTTASTPTPAASATPVATTPAGQTSASATPTSSPAGNLPANTTGAGTAIGTVSTVLPAAATRRAAAPSALPNTGGGAQQRRDAIALAATIVAGAAAACLAFGATAGWAARRRGPR